MNKRRRRIAKARRREQARQHQSPIQGDSMPINWAAWEFDKATWGGVDLARGESVTIVRDYRTNPPTTVHVTEHRQEPNGDHTLKVEDRRVGIRMRYIREWDLVETKKFNIG